MVFLQSLQQPTHMAGISHTQSSTVLTNANFIAMLYIQLYSLHKICTSVVSVHLKHQNSFDTVHGAEDVLAVILIKLLIKIRPHCLSKNASASKVWGYSVNPVYCLNRGRSPWVNLERKTRRSALMSICTNG